MLRVTVYGMAGILIVGSFLLVIYFQETKFYVDVYANHATVVGLILGIAGFALTIWTLFEGIRINEQSQNQVKEEISRYRREMSGLLDDIRSLAFRDSCDQAYSCLEQARHAIRADLRLRAIEKTEDARKFVLRVLEFTELLDSERTALRAIVEDLLSTISFIEQKARIKAVLRIPEEKLAPLDSLRDQLDQIRSRITKRLMEAGDAI